MQVVEEDVDHIAVVGEEEDVDHIGVLGEDEEETRVSIFLFYVFSFFLICCLLSGLALQTGKCQEKPVQQFYFSENILSVKIALKRFNFAK